MVYSEEGCSIVQRPPFVLPSRNMEGRPHLFLNGAGDRSQGFSHPRQTLDHCVNPQSTEGPLTDSWVYIDR